MGGRAVEGARLESVYTSKAYRGFESHPIRHKRRKPPPLTRDGSEIGKTGPQSFDLDLMGRVPPGFGQGILIPMTHGRKVEEKVGVAGGARGQLQAIGLNAKGDPARRRRRRW